MIFVVVVADPDGVTVTPPKVLFDAERTAPDAVTPTNWLASSEAMFGSVALPPVVGV